MIIIRKHRFNIITIVVVLIIITASFTFYYAYQAGKREVAEELLNAFYTFNLNTISENDAKIKDLTTDEIYETYTISSSNRQLRVYLKFQGNPAEAVLISHKDNIMYFSIKSSNFDIDRIFALHYKYSWGKITELVEYEVFLLPQSLRSDL